MIAKARKTKNSPKFFSLGESLRSSPNMSKSQNCTSLQQITIYMYKFQDQR